MSLGDTFPTSVVMQLAGPKAYARGVAYRDEGRVMPEAGGEFRMRAKVLGTVPYVVELWVDGDQPAWSCTCPAAEDGAFCKHCVAVALLFDSGGARHLHVVPDPTADDVDLRGYVTGLSHERLVELVLEAAESDRRLRERLDAEARAARGEGPTTM